MGLSIHNIKNWIKMLAGKSELHVNQCIGKIYSKSNILGYYNDFTEKVTKDCYYNEVKVPVLKIENNSEISFPISIFQFGLGAYDLFLLKKRELFLDKFKVCVEWAMENQKKDGSWNCFFFIHPEEPYSAMAQGEGVSLLLRAYIEYRDEKYLLAAKNAINFLIMSVDEGGTTQYINDEVFFQEYTHKPTVLNGWIFSLFGLYDYLKVVNDKKIIEIYYRSVRTMISHLKDFDNGFWSKYNMDNMITSPFYHKLHIAQLEALYDLTGESIFKCYSNKWKQYQNKWLNRKCAFIIKVFQKLAEK